MAMAPDDIWDSMLMYLDAHERLHGKGKGKDKRKKKRKALQAPKAVEANKKVHTHVLDRV